MRPEHLFYSLGILYFATGSMYFAKQLGEISRYAACISVSLSCLYFMWESNG